MVKPKVPGFKSLCWTNEEEESVSSGGRKRVKPKSLPVRTPTERSPRKGKKPDEKVNEKKKTRPPPVKEIDSSSKRESDDSSQSQRSSDQSIKAVQLLKRKKPVSRKVRNSSSERAQRSMEEEDELTTAKNRTFDDNELKTGEDRDDSSANSTGSLQATIGNMTRSLKHFALKCNRLTLEELIEQFNKLPDGKKEDCKAYLDPKNRTKNRYGNIYCLEKTRVHLQFLKEDGAYIHANRIRYPTLKNQFIITQGPLASTLVDFWRMIWQEKTENIVMLCNLSENGKPKSTEYFGQTLGSSSTFGQIVVKTCMRDYDQGLVITRLEMTWNRTTRTAMHYHMTDWRDCRAPVVCVRQMFQLLSAIRDCSTPTIVHCSAGVGRSGTLVALEMCLMDIAHGCLLDIFEVVKTLRNFRCHSVQTFEQYLALHKFVLQFGEQNECVTREEIQNFYRLFDTYSRNLP